MLNPRTHSRTLFFFSCTPFFYHFLGIKWFIITWLRLTDKNYWYNNNINTMILFVPLSLIPWGSFSHDPWESQKNKNVEKISDFNQILFINFTFSGSHYDYHRFRLLMVKSGVTGVRREGGKRNVFLLLKKRIERNWFTGSNPALVVTLIVVVTSFG